MDILKTKPVVFWTRSKIISLIVAVVFVLMMAALLQPKSMPKMERSKLLLGKVQRGDLEVMVDGYGILHSQKQTLITALTPATVAEVVLRPGAQVEEDSIILRLNNHDVLREVEAAQNILIQEQANLRRLALTNERELLTEQSALSELESNLKAASLRRDAEESLAAKGVIPQITFKTSVLQQEQIAQRVNFQRERIAQLKKVIKEAQLIQQKQIDQVEAHFQTMRLRAERLTVKAGLKGVLQRLPVELGQSVSAGQELALVGSDKDLLALIKVSQSKAEQVRVGHVATINIRREKAQGVVTRITPEVREGTVEVEIAFTNSVPAAARPELNVDAQIHTASLKNVLFMERPVNAQSHGNAGLFRLSADKKSAELQDLTFGEDAGKYIQIEHGAELNQTFILSDLAQVQDAKSIQLTN